MKFECPNCNKETDHTELNNRMWICPHCGEDMWVYDNEDFEEVEE